MEVLKHGAATERLETLAKQHAAEHGVNHYEAYAKVCELNPDLYARALAEPTAIVTQPDPVAKAADLPTVPPTPMVSRPRGEIEQAIQAQQAVIDDPHADEVFKRRAQHELDQLSVELDVLDDAGAAAINTAGLRKQLSDFEAMRAAVPAGDEHREQRESLDRMVIGAKSRLEGLEADPFRERRHAEAVASHGADSVRAEHLDINAVMKLAPIEQHRLLDRLRAEQAWRLQVISDMGDLDSPALKAEYSDEELAEFRDTVTENEAELAKLAPVVEDLRDALSLQVA